MQKFTPLIVLAIFAIAAVIMGLTMENATNKFASKKIEKTNG